MSILSVVRRCSRCNEEVEVLGALSLVGDPFVCVRCLDLRHAVLPGEPLPPRLSVPATAQLSVVE